MFVAKGTFAAPAIIRPVIRKTKESHVRSLCEEDIKIKMHHISKENLPSSFTANYLRSAMRSTHKEDFVSRTMSLNNCNSLICTIYH